MMRINFYNNNYNNQAPNFSGRKLGVSKSEIEALLRQGKSPKEIAVTYRHNPSWGNWIIKRFELSSLKSEKENDIVKQVIGLSEAGANIKTIAEIVSVSAKKVAKIITEFNVKKPKKLSSTKQQEKLERNNVIKGELAKGFSVKEVAENTGYSVSIVRNLAKDLNKKELKAAREQLKFEKTKELANSIYNDLKIGENIGNFIENNEKVKAAGTVIDKCQLSKELCQLRDAKYLKQVINLLNAGYIASEVAKELNCSSSTVSKYAGKAGITDIKERRRSLMREQIMNLVNQGKKLKEIAKELNCSFQALYNYMGNVGKLQRKEYLQHRENEIYRLHLQGVAHKEIAKQFNTSEDTVNRNIRRHQNRL